LGLLGSTCVYLGLLGSTGVYLGLLGSTCVYLGLLGSTFGYLGLLSLFQITIEWFRTLRAISGWTDGWTDGYLRLPVCLEHLTVLIIFLHAVIVLNGLVQ